MHIESGPTGERKVRSTLLFLMITGFAGWFAYDGWYGWPRQNVEEHLQQIPPEERDKARSGPVYATVTKRSLPEAEKALKALDRAAQRTALEKLYGGPPTYETPDKWYYFGPTFRVVVSLDTVPPALTYREAAHGDTDLLGQKLLAAALGLFGLYLVYHLYRVVTTRVVLSDAGLDYRGKGLIRWDQMRALDGSRFDEKGWIDLQYDDGSPHTLRLDEYHLQRFGAIIEEICRRKGFDNPLSTKNGVPGAPA